MFVVEGRGNSVRSLRTEESGKKCDLISPPPPPLRDREVSINHFSVADGHFSDMYGAGVGWISPAIR